VLLRAILITLNPSILPDETPTIPPDESPPGELVITLCLIYASLLMSLLAAFVAMLSKQWLNRYVRKTGRSMVERCGDRQRKLEGLRKWPLDTFVESLPVMLQIALLFLACGLCRHMITINTPIFGVLLALTALGVLFYIGIVISGTYSRECPFQTPASTNLRGLWKKVGPRTTVVASSIISALRGLWEILLCQILRNMLHLPLDLGAWHCFRRPHPQGIGENSPTPFAALSELWKNIWSKILRPALRFSFASRLDLSGRSHRLPLPTTVGSAVPLEVIPQPTPEGPATPRMNSKNDARCVSWILIEITDPEALDAAVRLAGTIRWFEEGIDVKPSYDIIVSIFNSSLDSTKKVYPGMRERAYYSLRAVLWIYALVKCKFPESVRRYPLPVVAEVETPTDDLTHLLSVCFHLNTLQSCPSTFSTIYTVPHGASNEHAQWMSNILLHLAWTERGDPSVFYWFDQFVETGYRYNDLDTIPLDATLNRFMVWCIFLSSRVEEEVLRIQDKSFVISHSFFQVTHAIVH